MDFAHKWTDEQLKKLEKKIAREYSEAAAGISAKLDKYLARYRKELEQREKALDDTQEAAEQHKAWLESQALVITRMTRMIDELSESAVTANKKAAELINDSLPSTYAENANRAAYEIDSAIHMSTNFTLVDESTVRALLGMSEEDQLIKEVIEYGPPKPLVQSVRLAQVDEARDMAWNRQKFNSAILQGILQGESIPNMAKRLSSIYRSNKAAAVRAARTATTCAENMGRISSYERAQGLGIDILQEWMATLDGRTRDSHRALDGERIEIGETFSNGCKYPGDPSGPASEVYNCRCTVRGRVTGFDGKKSQSKENGGWLEDPWGDSNLGNRWKKLPQGTTYTMWKNGFYVTDKRGRETVLSIDKRREIQLAVENEMMRAKLEEPAASAILQALARENGYTLTGFEHRFKGEDSFKRKVIGDAKELADDLDDIRFSDVAGDINDGLRYTMLLDTESFKDEYESILAKLEEAGYSVVRVKNSLAKTDGSYRGMNTIVRAPSGYMFELQFHTPESWDAKNKAHYFYEIERTSEQGSKKRKEAKDAQYDIYTSVPMPVGSEQIESYDNRPKAKTRMRRLVGEGIESYRPEEDIDGGFTLRSPDAKTYRLGESSGYAVGGFGTEWILPPEVYEDVDKRNEAIESFMRENSDALRKRGACLGGWIPSSGEYKGQLFLDVSVVTETIDEALDYAIINGEDSITDFKNVDWPSVEELAKERGRLEEYEEARKRKLAERG